jgi:hypothetical protein
MRGTLLNRCRTVGGRCVSPPVDLHRIDTVIEKPEEIFLVAQFEKLRGEMAACGI